MFRLHMLWGTIVMLCLVSMSVSGDLCEDVDESLLSKQMHKSSAPKGGRNAGLYTRGMVDGNNVTTLIECLVSCCADLTCNVMFFHQDRCYLIACNRTVPDACDPVEHTDYKFRNTYYIAVRSLEESAHISMSETSPGSSTNMAPGGSTNLAPDGASTDAVDCTIDTNEGCGVNQQCNMFLSKDRMRYRCDCIKGYDIDKDLRCTVRSADVTCEVGVSGECLDNEECVNKHSRSRTGQCNCVSGYSHHPHTRLCVTMPESSDEDDKEVYIDTKVDLKPDPSSTPGVMVSSTSLPSQQNPAPTKHPLVPLVVSAGDSQEIRLPKDSTTLHVFVIPSDDQDAYQYQWSVVSKTAGDVGDMVGINTDSLQLSHLVAGLYVFKVVVTAEGKYGEAEVNVTVNPPTRINEPPVAIIKPAMQMVNQPNDVILDGSESEDDDKISQYNWEQVSRPMEAPGIPDKDTDKSTLVLKALLPGSYMFKLTVTDSNGAMNYTFANVTVIKEKDYPPRANAGSNVIINLPQNSVILNGNASSDDKRIASFEWIKKSDDRLTADMKGVRTPMLELEHLEEGDYTFTLKVTDTAGQVDTADVHVFVKAEHNKVPVASAGQNQTLWLPQSMATLDASNSTDDQGIESYTWTQVSGATSIVLKNDDRAIATAPNLKAGVYKFKVTVVDKEGLHSSDSVYITVKQDENKGPTVNSGGHVVISLPAPLVKMDGSKSTDDHGIISWEWTRDDSSLAVGTVINGSDHQAVLQLTGLVAGRYVFTLKVVDAEGLSDSGSATLTVNPEKNKEDLIELTLNTDIHAFTYANKKNLQSQLALLLHKNVPNAQVTAQELTEDKGSGHLLVIFYVWRPVVGGPDEVIPGSQVAASLQDRLWSDNSLLDFQVVAIDTLICQNNCTDHGHCDQSTKTCICEAFWMQNPFLAYFEGNSNCEWSVLYVIIVAFVSLVTLIGVVWGLIFLCRRWYWTQPKKRHRYSLLDDVDDNSDRNSMDLVQKGKFTKLQSGSLMISESDFSSDEETLFINKKANGHGGKNGIVRPTKSKVKA